MAVCAILLPLAYAAQLSNGFLSLGAGNIGKDNTVYVKSSGGGVAISWRAPCQPRFGFECLLLNYSLTCSYSYTDGGIVREGVAGESVDGAYSAGVSAL